MGAVEFRWATLSADLLSALATVDAVRGVDATSSSDVASALEAAFGPVPVEAQVPELWAAMRTWWILPDEERSSRVAALFDEVGVGRAAREAHPDDAGFLRSVRNSPLLRAVVLDLLIALGSPSGAAGDVVERAAAPDRQRRIITFAEASDPSIPSEDFAPRGLSDFARLERLADMNWNRYLVDVFGRVQGLLPSESVVLRSILDEPNNGGSRPAYLGLTVVRETTGTLIVIVPPEELLPAGLTHAVLATKLRDVELGLDANGVVSREFSWPDEIDDAASVAIHVLREALGVTSPAQIDEPLEVAPPEGLLPSAPAPNDVVRPVGAAEALSVVASIIRGVQGKVYAGGAANTMEIVLGPWSGWVHVASDQPVLDVVLVAAQGKEGPVRLEASDVLALQSSAIQFGRVVLSGNQALVAVTTPIHAFTGEALLTLLGGLMQDAASLAAVVGRAPEVASVGGYL